MTTINFMRWTSSIQNNDGRFVKNETYVRQEEQRRRDLARQITWSGNSTRDEVKIYKEIRRLILLGYDKDDIFKMAAKHLSQPDRQILSSFLDKHLPATFLPD